MTQREENILDKKLKGINARILMTGVSLLVAGVFGITTAYNGLLLAIEKGKDKDATQDTRMSTHEERMTTIETNVSQKAWRSEVDNLHDRVVLNEQYNAAMKK